VRHPRLGRERAKIGIVCHGTNAFLKVGVESRFDDTNIRQPLQTHPEPSLDILKVNICEKSSRAGNIDQSDKIDCLIVTSRLRAIVEEPFELPAQCLAPENTRVPIDCNQCIPVATT